MELSPAVGTWLRSGLSEPRCERLRRPPLLEYGLI